MQNLWDVLPDFNSQRKSQKQISHESLRNALLGIPFSGLIPKRTSSLFDGGAVGGPNASQGFERDSLGNPWSIIFCIEGTIMLAGCIAKRLGILSGATPSFPFQTRLTPTSMDSYSDKESTGREIWLPLWNSFTGIGEIEALFSEGRASVGKRTSSRGVDFARAVASLGVDRGIRSFQRYAIVKGRVGGDNYNTSTSFGRFDVRARPDVDLLKEADTWLDRYRGAASGDKVPPRFSSALRRIESAIFVFCRFGGAARFAEILCAFGNAERQLALGEKFRKDKQIRPLSRLSPEWTQAADDNSTEFLLARALAGIFDPEKKVEPIRSNFEPVLFGKWKEGDFCDVWNNAGLPNNLISVLERRLMDAEKRGCQNLPLASHHRATINAIATYIAGGIDDGRIEELLWGMILVDHHKPQENKSPLYIAEEGQEEGGNESPLPRPYAFLKLLFLPHGLNVGDTVISARPEPAITALLRAGRAKEACAIAARRLKSSGLTPMTYQRGGKLLNEVDWQIDGIEPMRLGAALLFPVSIQGINHLKQMVIRPNKKGLLQ
jgi:CRISPR-associated protein Csx17